MPVYFLEIGLARKIDGTAKKIDGTRLLLPLSPFSCVVPYTCATPKTPLFCFLLFSFVFFCFILFQPVVQRSCAGR